MSDQAVKLTAVISATSKGLVDALKQAQGAVNSTTSNWKERFASLKDATSTISQSVKNLSDLVSQVGNVDMDVQGLEQVKQAISAVSGNFSEVRSEVDAFVQALSAMKQEASALSMPLEDFQRFGEAVKASGLSMNEAKEMIAQMQRNIQDFANGVPRAQEQFAKLGLSLEQVSSNSVAGNFQAITHAINDTIPASERATQSMEMFKASIDKTLAVTDQYNKSMSKQSGSYASDKDLQNAIGLSNVIGKLGEQVGALANQEKNATSAGAGFYASLNEIFSIVKGEKDVLDALLVEYANYTSSLKSGATSTLDASKALETLKKTARTLRDQLEFTSFFGEGEGGSGLYFEDLKGKLSNLVNFVGTAKEQITNEMDAVRAIMNQRLNAGAPIDTKEIDVALDHIEDLKSALYAIYDSAVDFEQIKGFIPEDAISEIVQLTEYLNGFGAKFVEMDEKARSLNFPLKFEEASKTMESFSEKLSKVLQDLGRGIRVPIDMTEIEDARKKLSELAPDPEHIDESKAKIEGLINQMDMLRHMAGQVNKEIEKGVPATTPLVRLFDIVNQRIGRIRQSLRGGLRSAWSDLVAWATRYKNKVDEAGNAGQSLGQIFGQATKQMLGIGTAVAVIVKAWRNLVELGKEWLRTLQEADKIRTFGNASENAKELTRTREKGDKERDDMSKKLVEFASLYDEERRGSREAGAKRVTLQKELKDMYGFEFQSGSGSKNMEAQISEMLDKLAKKRIESIDAQINANERVKEGVDKFVDSFSGFSGYWKMLGYTFTGDRNGNNAIKEAQEKSTEAMNNTLEMREERRRLEREDLKGQFNRLRQAKRADEIEKKRKEEAEKAKKAEEERRKLLEEANKKLAEWKASVSDNDRQKALRAILKKYEEVVKGGVSEQEARNAAEAEIAKMLKGEKEEQDKKNKELLDALDDRIKAYKDAYREFLESQRDLNEARKDYAKTQKRLAQEAQAEADDKRKERIQKRMSRYGFELPDNFRMRETPSRRRRRRRRIELDESISDKMERWEAGERVHFTARERRRIKSLEKLTEQDKALEASQKQMQAADKQEQAAETMRQATRAVYEAFYNRKDALKSLKESGGELGKASRRRRRRDINLSPEDMFRRLRVNGFNARGVRGATSTRVRGYQRELSRLHTDLQELYRKVFFVK